MMKNPRIWLVLVLLAVSVTGFLGSAQPKSVKYYDLIQYPLRDGDNMHVTVSLRGDDIFVGQGSNLITIASGLVGLIPPRIFSEEFGVTHDVSSMETGKDSCYVSTGSIVRAYSVPPRWRVNRALVEGKRLYSSWTNRGMVRSGNTLYVIAMEWFYIYDVTIPTAPVLLNKGHTDMGAYFSGKDVAVEGNYIFLATGDGFCVVDVSDKTHPKVVIKRKNSRPDGNDGIAVFTKNNRTYVLLTRGSKGFFVYEFTPNPTPKITLLRRITEHGRITGVIGRSVGIVDDVALLKIGAAVYALIGTTNGLFVVDVTTPNTASVVGFLFSEKGKGATQRVVSVAVRGTTAYLAEKNRGYHVGIRVVDVSIPVGGGTYP